MQEQQEKVRQLVEVLDHALNQAGCGILDALNAVSIMSTSIAHSLGLAQKEYLDNLTFMFEQTKPHIEPIPFMGMVDTGEDNAK